MRIDDQGFHLDSDAFQAQLDAVLKGLEGEEVGDAMQELASLAEGVTKERYVPVLTGRLSNSITGRADPDRQGFTLRTNNVVYSAVQEFEEWFHHPDKGPTGERGAHYILRGMLFASDNAGEVLLRMHQNLWGG